MQTILFWADGTWVTKEEYREHNYSWKSDDIGTLEVSEDALDTEIDKLVLAAVG